MEDLSVNKTLVLEGGGNISIEENGTIRGAAKVHQSGNSLTIEGEAC